jgi:hypothetical protein
MTYIAEGHDLGARRSDRFADIKMPGLVTEPLLVVEEISHRVANEYAGAIAAINFEATRIADADARAALRRTTTAIVRDHADDFTADLSDLDNDHPVGCFEAVLNRVGDKLCDDQRHATTASGRQHDDILNEDESYATLSKAGLRKSRADAVEVAAQTHVASSGRRLQRAMRLGECVQLVGCTPNPPPSRGRRIVERLARELGGDIQWFFGPKGVTATLAFPASQNLADALASAVP